MELVRPVSGNEQDMVTNEPTKMTNIEKGLYLLHSVRAVGQRQKTHYYPFQLLNSTGLPLRFATISSIPSQVYVSASTYPQRSQQVVKGNLRESEWRLVEPNQQVPFDCRMNSKMRHKVNFVIALIDNNTHNPYFTLSYNTVVLYSRDRYEIIGLRKSSHSIKQPCNSICLKKAFAMHQSC